MDNLDRQIKQLDEIFGYEEKSLDLWLEKRRVYLKPGEKPPEGKESREGKRGGYYYETGEGRESTQEDEPTIAGEKLEYDEYPGGFTFRSKNVFGQVKLDSDSNSAKISATYATGDRENYKTHFKNLVSQMDKKVPKEYSLTAEPSSHEAQAFFESLVNDGIAARKYVSGTGDTYEIDRSFKSKEVKEYTILDRISASYSSLRSDCEKFDIEGVDAYIIQGVLYYPPEGGSSLNTDNIIAIGPRDWIGKYWYEVPEVKKSIMERYKKGLHVDGGDFSKTEETQDRKIISNVLFRYKSPVAENASYLNRLAKAYFSSGKVENFDKQHIIDKIGEENEIRAKYGLDKDPLFDSEDKIYREILRGLTINEYEGSKYSQDAVNQFFSEVQNTQKVLKEKFPDGKVVLYRGVRGGYAKSVKDAVNKGEDIEIQNGNATSWTSRRGVAEDFATGEVYGSKTRKSQIILKKEFDVKEVLFSHLTSENLSTESHGWMPSSEKEFEFIIGNDDGKTVLSRDQVEILK